MNNVLLNRYNELKNYIGELGSVAVAYSSGVDSTFLLFAAVDALGPEKVIAITANSASFPVREAAEALDYCTERDIRQVVYDFDSMSIEGFKENPANRCYICKKGLFSGIIKTAKDYGMNAVLEGSNKDDDGDYRPGLKAIMELKVKSPLRELGFTKQEIRDLSEHLGIPTWDKPSYACLATRIPYGESITNEKLSMIDRGEQFLIDLGFKQMRVRIHGGNLARIELMPEEMSRFMREDIRLKVYEEFKRIGFVYVSIDIAGYKTGNMNSGLL